VGLYLRRGAACSAVGDQAHAEADFSRALEIDPCCAEALAGRARARAVQGRHAEAVADARQAACIEPELGMLETALATVTSDAAEPDRIPRTGAG
jgi:tetratricopeptide (TPR) repeat protein